MAKTITIGDGRYFAAAGRDVLPLPSDWEMARGWAQRLLASDSHQILAYLEHEMPLPLSPEPVDLLGVVTELLFHGVLTIVCDEAPARPLDAPEIRNLIDPLVDPTIDPLIPTGPREPRTPVEPDTWVSFEVVDQQGDPIGGDFRCLVDGRTEVGLLEDGTQRYEPIAQGNAAQLYIDGLVLARRADVAPVDGPERPGDAPATPDAPVDPPSIPAKPSPDPGEPGGPSDADEPQSAAQIYRFERYYPGQRAFIPREIPTTSGELDSIDLLADFLVAAAADSGWTQMVVAHADASGSSGNNQEITDARAQSMRAVVVGDQETWLDTIAADDQQVASRVLFHWLAARYGWDTDTRTQPGWNERCVAALRTYRAQVSEHLGCPVGGADRMERVDWACAFEMIQDALIGSLRGNPETLSVLRGSLSIADSQVCGCGARFETEATEPSDAEAVRRVELVLLEDSRALTAEREDANGLYDRERVEHTIIVHAPRVALRLRVRAAEGLPLGGVPYQLKVNGFPTTGQSSAEGMLKAPRVPLGEFAVELHDPVLLLAHDLAQRVHSAIEDDVPAALLSLLSQTDEVAASLAKVYERLFGAALVDAVEHATTGTAIELMVAALLARCGLKPDDRFAFHYFDATREFP